MNTHNYTEEGWTNAGHFPKWKHSLECEPGWYLKRADVKVQSWLDTWLGGFFSAEIYALLWVSDKDATLRQNQKVRGGLLLSVRQRHSFGMRCSWCLTFTLYHSRICECVSGGEVHTDACDCGSLTGSSWCLVRPLLSLIVSLSALPFSTSCPQTHPQEAGSLSPRHLWVSPDGGKASGNERKQPSLSERIRTAVHHHADLQGVCRRVHVKVYQQLTQCVCVCMCILSHWPTGSVCECVHMFVHQCRVCETMCVH